MERPVKPKLLILSDLWGKQKMAWLTQYIEQLENEFKVVFKDCRELGQVDTTIHEEKGLHESFVNGGINRAVSTLSADHIEYAALLGVSIGGTIGWKAISQGLKVQRYYGVSATRLRYETEKPDVPIWLYYGQNDPFISDTEWLKAMDIKRRFLPLNHKMYYEQEVAKLVCQQIINDMDKNDNLNRIEQEIK